MPLSHEANAEWCAGVCTIVFDGTRHCENLSNGAANRIDAQGGMRFVRCTKLLLALDNQAGQWHQKALLRPFCPSSDSRP